jgi:hypothetical protein
VLPADRVAFDLVASHLSRPGAQGWARFRSRAVEAGAAIPTFEMAGPPIAAEWIAADGSSVHVRPDAAPDGAGRLVQYDYAERPLFDSALALAEGETAVLRQVMNVLRRTSSKREDDLSGWQKVLRYHVYWGAAEDEPSAVRRLFYRFAGFGEASLDRRAESAEQTR